jgi:hypothetical protein
MRRFARSVLACAAILSGCVSAGSDLPPGATEVTLANGVYRASFAGGCQTMTIGEGGQKIHYTSGPCGGSPTFTSAGSFDGETIRIMQATYKLSNATKSSLTGRWTLGTYTTIVTFRK